MCDGTKVFKHSGYHSPLNPFKWKSCPYCDHNGLQLIEAHANSIAEYFAQLDDDQRKLLLQKIAQKKLADN
jgi:hypothetical protein